ncbi:hypothetical protein WJX74_000919 [Apatococcus lobatus]|uniref:SnoaL-like domain-containing protein n=1 Tax=Apatococcus lobatus TaxID=904363 RepID=A0AAW1QJ41_9CHLO
MFSTGLSATPVEWHSVAEPLAPHFQSSHTPLLGQNHARLHCICPMQRPGRPQRSLSMISRGLHQQLKATSRQELTKAAQPEMDSQQLIREFYKRYNAGDVDAVLALMSDDIEYHDMALYQEPHQGKDAVRSYFKMIVRTIPRDLKFYVDAITANDPRNVGVKWHVDLEGIEFPFTRGVSFYELDEQGRMRRGRDLLESPFKPGRPVLFFLKALVPLVRKLGPRANPGVLKGVPLKAYAVWALYAGYITFILLSRAAPGGPAWETSFSTIQEIFNESLNFFYVNIAAGAVGLPSLPVPAVHPVNEALFNLVGAWGMMLLPLMLQDKRAGHVKKKWTIWVATMLLTNIFFIPWMALRLMPAKEGRFTMDRSKAEKPALPGFAPALGAVAIVVGSVSLGWAALARPEFGGLAERIGHFSHMYSSDRVFYAFVLDTWLYAVWQALLMEDAPLKYRLVPFFGAAAWLINPEKSST